MNWTWEEATAAIERGVSAEVLALRFAAGEGTWSGDGWANATNWDGDLPLFRGRISVVRAVQAGLPLAVKRLQYLRIRVYSSDIDRPGEYDADPEGKCISAYSLGHTPWGWTEKFCMGGAPTYHVIKENVVERQAAPMC